MASYTYEQLKEMTVAQLREIAQGVESEAVKGFSTMHKDHLLPALCNALGIQVHHVAVGAEKARMKATIRKLKSGRDKALAARDRAGLATIRRHIHALKRRLRRMADQSA
jgi:hypothetical protein